MSIKGHGATAGFLHEMNEALASSIIYSKRTTLSYQPPPNPQLERVMYRTYEEARVSKESGLRFSRVATPPGALTSSKDSAVVTSGLIFVHCDPACTEYASCRLESPGECSRK